jgi:feruloyl esterase
MHHCGGGSGPNSFDPLTPLIQWVEADKTPDQIVAYHFKNNDPANNPVPDRSMPLCPYPQVAVFQGGDVNAATSWKCGAHADHRFSPGHPGGKK